MQDTLDLIKNVENIYNSDNAFQVLKDFERVLDELDLYVYENWKDGELLSGPNITRHWIACSFIWDRDQMPDPMGGNRLTDYDCKVSYNKDDIIVPRKIKQPSDMRSGTKKGKLDRKPIWVVNIEMPKSLLQDIYGGYKETVLSPANDQTTQAQQEPQQADVEAQPEGMEELA